MSKHLTATETLKIMYDAQDGTRAVLEQDGARNAALFATIEKTAERFHVHPHAPETTTALADAMDRVGQAYRVADSYRVVYASALHQLNLLDDRTVDYAHRACAQYTAATEQLAGALSDARVALHDRLPVGPA